jgi:3'-phosphoadenosine 5'-phosphosulfate sulfotransferase (PAPS reductase)/FAD synthetase
MTDLRLPIFDRTIDQAIAEAVEIVQEAKVEHRPSRTFLLYSGGNDSQVLLHAMAPFADEIVHVDTGVGIPEVADFCRRVASGFQLPYTEERPPRSYDSLVLTKGITGVVSGWDGLPGPGMHRYTYSRLKERCFEAVLRRHRQYNGERFMLLSGIRRAESARRSKTATVHRKGGQVWVQPLNSWDNDEMAEYRKRFDIPQSEVAANLHMSGECLCGAMADQGPDREERSQIRFFYPQFDKRLTLLEQACERKQLTYCEWGIKRPDDPALDAAAWTPACQSCAWRQEPFDLEGPVS